MAMNFDGVSRHMAKKLQFIVPRVLSAHPPVPDGINPIDLSVAENHVLHSEISKLFKDAISTGINANVS